MAKALTFIIYHSFIHHEGAGIHFKQYHNITSGLSKLVQGSLKSSRNSIYEIGSQATSTKDKSV